MTAIFLVDSATDHKQATADRGRLEGVLRESGYSLVPLDAQLRARVTALVDGADGAQLERLTAAATSEKDDLDERFWGPSPDSTTATRAVFEDLSDQFAQRRQVAADAISRDEAAELLGVSAQSITARLTSGKLVGIKVGREWRLPAWQFDPDDATGVLPDLDALQDVFPGGAVSLSRWMSQSRPEFDGRTAREQMVRYGSAAVLDFARTLTATGW
ncbi:helix-turn-helix domain-containing protein [Mycolicibacterium arenosum]|uniref:Helix-turn-helix domain-containing protein n=1 Tax=Mycolicibacterium arenosum TaxID=2952157 RepID=A0ABT1M4A5_9MYCO|nr:helix-turn-helix domain-containing protein [Mycolicibacterium sp. CAU 1645]MCP9273998.1 helix-turn-helix domain-containing protein [Mycolicibacterium sp. CAU 1645]